MIVPAEINVGLMGLGVVGGGVAKALLERPETISRKVGHQLNLKRVLVREAGKSRPVKVPENLLTTDPKDILADSEIHIVVEVMGGAEPAAAYLSQALSAGKHVVTANKEVMAKHGADLTALARQNGANLLFEASVGGGIPIVGCLMNELAANEVRSIRSIINGTTNYILTRMAYQGADFRQALTEAQELGYAEADHTNDTEGIDAGYKLAILASLAFHRNVAHESVYREGISGLEPQDFRYAQELGYAIKSLAIATLEGNDVRARVYPALIPLDHMLGKVDGVYNAVEVQGDLCGQVLFHGMGAGQEPTTSAVVGDVIEVARLMVSHPQKVAGAEVDTPKGDVGLSTGDGGPETGIKTMDDLSCKYYLRLNVADRPGVLAQIARILGDGNISIASVLQKDSNQAERTAEIVITTHPALESAVQNSLRSMADLADVRQINNLLRIEE